MTSQSTPAAENRPKLNFAFDDEPETTENVVRKVEEISEKTGFTARAPRPAVSRPKVANEPKPAPVSTMRTRRRRVATERVEAFNTKLKPGYHDKIIALADLATAQEGRLVTLAEIIERGTDLLHAQMNAAE